MGTGSRDKLVITGGWKLSGTTGVQGSKNATLPILGATILTGGECSLLGTPRITDVEVMLKILRLLGADVRTFRGELVVDTKGIGSCHIPPNLMREMRSTIFLMGPLLGRMRKVIISHPGGCAIGNRPIDLHLKALSAMGVEIRDDHGFIVGTAPRGLSGCDLHLDFPSVGATENVMMAAVLARGTTVLRNAAKEPEIVDLQNFLNNTGARIMGAGTDTIRIEGVDSLSGTKHTVIPDRIVAGTLLIAVALAGGKVRLEGIIVEHLEPVIAKLREVGSELTMGDDWVVVEGRRPIRAVESVRTLPYPGFPTDLQAPMMSLLSYAEGTSIITETIFDGRYHHVDELRRMGAQIKLDGRTAMMKGVERLSGTAVEATDLRAAAGLVIAGLAADGITVVEKIHHLDRGYERLEDTLRSLGAKVDRAKAA
ncbi:MAG: UDP-N-acetylglucosamine 1-carboxyvinyltransferase [Firmicutes bacterium]|nr:UDP-N-acetylglucosamine 1-carboxyvinyltransferase [Bacillota bacterium]